MDTELVAAVCAAVDVPVVAAGGLAGAEDAAAAANAGAAAVAAASALHYGTQTVQSLKQGLAALGVEVRPCE